MRIWKRMTFWLAFSSDIVELTINYCPHLTPLSIKAYFRVMNVIFHTTAAIGVAVLLTKTDKIEHSKNAQKQVFQTSIFTFIVAVLSHGLLDYIPHCYPINSKN